MTSDGRNQTVIGGMELICTIKWTFTAVKSLYKYEIPAFINFAGQIKNYSVNNYSVPALSDELRHRLAQMLEQSMGFVMSEANHSLLKIH